jgi:hypothetical protein
MKWREIAEEIRKDYYELLNKYQELQHEFLVVLQQRNQLYEMYESLFQALKELDQNFQTKGTEAIKKGDPIN